MRSVLAITSALLALTAAQASADGLPVMDLGQRPDSVEIPGGGGLAPVRAGQNTVAARVMGTRVADSVFLRGRWAVPAVAYDGTAGGVAAGSHRVVLIRPRRSFPRARTQLTVLNARLEVVRRVDLEGDFSFDAVSPDGSALFLVEYRDRRDPTVYRVRVYDVGAGRLEPEPLLDSRTTKIVMRGLPLTRAQVGDTDYTLYNGLGDPFIHALDTQRRAALCIPLPGRNASAAQLKASADGDWLTVSGARGAVAVVDTQANVARAPASGWWPLAALIPARV